MKNNTKTNIKLFEAFAGIGSQYKALKNISKSKNWNIIPSGIIEWFVPAIVSYELLHNKNINLIDELSNDFNFELSLSNDSKKPINKISLIKLKKSKLSKYIYSSYINHKNTFDIRKTTYKNIEKNIDIFTYSFPCQDLSVQGKQKGMSKDSGTRSSLLWEVERILLELKENYKFTEMPKYLLMENVAGVADKKNIYEFNNWKKSLEKIGYDSKLYILNSKDFGSCQNRKRAFLLSVRKDWKEKVNFEFVDIKKSTKEMKLNEILLDDDDEKLYLDFLLKYNMSDFKYTKSNICRASLLGYTNFNSESYVYDTKGVGPTLTATGANSRIKIYTNNKRIRMMSNLEKFLYMGFDKNDFNIINESKLITNQNMTFLCGNSISIQVLERIFETLKF